MGETACPTSLDRPISLVFSLADSAIDAILFKSIREGKWRRWLFTAINRRAFGKGGQ